MICPRSHDVHYPLMLLSRIRAEEFHTEKVSSSHCAGLQHQKAGCPVPPWNLVLRSHDLSPQVQTCGAAVLRGDGLFPCPGHPLHGKSHLPSGRTPIFWRNHMCELDLPLETVSQAPSSGSRGNGLSRSVCLPDAAENMESSPGSCSIPSA